MDDRFAVLVVDDDPDIRETLRDVIEAEGHAVVTADSGRAALDALLHGRRPSLIVLDLMMPGMSGWDLLAVIRDNRALADIPVAVISASGTRTTPTGATHFLRKPIELDALLDIVRDPGPRTPRSAPDRARGEPREARYGHADGWSRRAV